MDFDNFTWVGEVPEHVIYELKVPPGWESAANYIVLPLDTTIKRASQICNDAELGMRGTEVIGVWDVDEQVITNPWSEGALHCNAINAGLDFDVNAGQVYYITIPKSTTWHQK